MFLPVFCIIVSSFLSIYEECYPKIGGRLHPLSFTLQEQQILFLRVKFNTDFSYLFLFWIVTDNSCILKLSVEMIYLLPDKLEFIH